MAFGAVFGQLRRSANKQYKNLGLPRLTQQHLVDTLTELSDGALCFSVVDVSRWENDKRRIRAEQRQLLVAIVQVFHRYAAISSLADANRLLAAGNYLELTKSEIERIAPTWLDELHIAQRYSKAAPVSPFTNLPILKPALGLEQATIEVVEMLHNARQNKAIVTVTGLGGAGKTLLAIHAAHRVAQMGQPVLFIYVDSDVELSAGGKLRHFIRSFWEQLSGRTSGKYSDAALREKITRLLNNQELTIVVDGLISRDEATKFSGYLRELSAVASILVTSRVRLAEEFNAEDLPIYDLPSHIAAKFVREQLSLRKVRLDDRQMALLITAVGGNPLALATAIGAMKRGYPLSTLIELIQSGNSKAFLVIYSKIFGQIWRSLTVPERQVILSFLFFAERQAPVDRLRAVSGINETKQFTDVAISLVDCAFLVPDFDGFEVQTLVRQYVSDRAAEACIRPIMLELTQHAIDDWLLKFELMVQDDWDEIERNQRELFQTLRTSVALIPFADTKLHNDLVLMVRRVSAFVVACGYTQEWFPLLCDISEALPFRQDKQRCRVISNVGIISRLAQQLDVAINAHLEGLAIGQALDDEFEVAQSLYNLGVSYEVQGKWSESLKFGNDAMALFEGLNHGVGIAYCCNLLGFTQFRSGHFDSAEKYFNQAIYYFKKQGFMAEAARSMSNLAFLHHEQDEFASALEILDRAETLLRQQSNKAVQLQLLIEKASVLVDVSLLDEAHLLLQETSELELEQLGIQLLQARYYQVHGKLTLRRGNYSDALENLECSNRIWIDMGGDLEQIQTLLDLIKAHRLNGTLIQARRYYTDAEYLLTTNQQYAKYAQLQQELESYHPQLYGSFKGVLQ